MGLITTDLSNWIYEHCATKEDVQSYIERLQTIKDNWVDDVEEEEYRPPMKKYCVHVGVRYTTDVYVIARDRHKAVELAVNYANDMPLTLMDFAGDDTDWWEEEFDDDDANVVEEIQL